MNGDAQILRTLIAHLENMPILQSTQLTLSVDDGIVTIAGSVNTLAQRKAIERAAARVPNIKTVILAIAASLTRPSLVESASFLTEGTKVV